MSIEETESDDVPVGWQKEDNVLIAAPVVEKKDTHETDISSEQQQSKWGSINNHFVVALLTLWWTAGAGNIAYAIYKRLDYDKNGG